jgi:hypothetical protein
MGVFQSKPHLSLEEQKNPGKPKTSESSHSEKSDMEWTANPDSGNGSGGSASNKYGLGEKRVESGPSPEEMEAEAQQVAKEAAEKERLNRLNARVPEVYEFNSRKWKLGTTYSSVPVTQEGLVNTEEKGEWIVYNAAKKRWEQGDLTDILWAMKGEKQAGSEWPKNGKWMKVGGQGGKYYGKEPERPGVRVYAAQKRY